MGGSVASSAGRAKVARKRLRSSRYAGLCRYAEGRVRAFGLRVGGRMQGTRCCQFLGHGDLRDLGSLCSGRQLWPPVSAGWGWLQLVWGMGLGQGGQWGK